MSNLQYPESQKHTGSYTDYRLVSGGSVSQEWKHNLMRLHAPDAALNPRDWVQPLRLNRRDDAALRKEEALAAGVELVEDPKWTPPVMEEQDKTKVAPGSVAKLDGMRKPFQKKTQRIFQTDESAASLQLSREERRPYLLEDSHEPATSKDRQRWIGRFEGGQTGSAITNTTSRYVLFLLTEDPSGGNGKMQVVSVDRSYKFTQKRLSKFKDVEQADQEERLFSSWLPKLTLRQFTRRVKSKYEDRWANRVKVEAGPSTSKVKTEPGAPRIKTEDLAVPKRFTAVHGENKRRKPKVAGDDQSDGEFDFDEEFQDDEEGAGGYMDDNALMDESEAKELAEKIKKDQKGGLVGDGADKDELFDASDSDEERRKLNKAGKEALKLLKKQGRNEYMDSDDELEEEEEPEKKPAEATKQPESSSRASRPPSISTSRANSPTATGIVAKRATSPTRSRAASPSTLSGTKRKAEDMDGESDSGKKPRTSKVPEVDPETAKRLLTEEVIVGFVKSVRDPKDATAKNLLKFIKSKLGINVRQPGVSELLQSLIKGTCSLNDGVLVLKR